MSGEAIVFFVIISVVILWISLDQYRLRRTPKPHQKHEKEKVAQILDQIEEAKEKKHNEVEDLINLGEQLLKLKEFQDPKTRKIIEGEIRKGKRTLKDNEE